jgi:hypothetical protein
MADFLLFVFVAVPLEIFFWAGIPRLARGLARRA